MMIARIRAALNALAQPAEPEILFHKLHEAAIIPSRSTDGSAGWDLATPYSFVWDTWLSRAFAVNLHLAVGIPSGYVGLMRARSGAAFRIEHIVFEGTVDSDYRGAMRALLLPIGPPQTLVFEKGDRVAQLVVVPAPRLRSRVVSALPASERGAGGFGSTGR